MRTTVELEDDVMRIVKGLAREKKQTLGRVLSNLVREALAPEVSQARVRNGFHLLEVTQPGIVITNDLIDRIKEEEEEEEALAAAAYILR
jgi:hypothetical protein